MRARLLDLGQVGAVRSQSVYHAVAAAMGAGDDAVVILSRPATAFVSVGDGAAKEVDADFCRRHGLPVLHRAIGGAAALCDPNQILFQVVVPAARAGELGLPDDDLGRDEALARPLVEAYRRLGVAAAAFRPPLAVGIGGIGGIGDGGDGDAANATNATKSLGPLASGEIGAASCFAGGLVCDLDPALAGAVRSPATTSVAAETGAAPALADAAEALIAALESTFGLELIPSMPTPAELDAIYDWDRRVTSDDSLGRADVPSSPEREVVVGVH